MKTRSFRLAFFPQDIQIMTPNKTACLPGQEVTVKEDINPYLLMGALWNHRLLKKNLATGSHFHNRLRQDLLEAKKPGPKTPADEQQILEASEVFAYFVGEDNCTAFSAVAEFTEFPKAWIYAKIELKRSRAITIYDLTPGENVWRAVDLAAESEDAGVASKAAGLAG